MTSLPGIELIEKVGEGGMATVWKARDAVDGRILAVKMLDPALSDDREVVEQFIAEERLLEEIRHPGVVKGYACSKVANQWFYIMEFVDGYTFADLLRRKQHVGEMDCLLICESVAVTLNAVWNDHGVVHCDLKPENIMINRDGEVKLTDLGIFHRFEFREGGQEVPEHILGTPAYISPEQVYGDIEPDCRSDIYSLAATLYHLSTGRVLFAGLDNDASLRAHCDPDSQGRDPRTYRPELSEGFCQMLEAMLVKDRDYRVSTWQDVYQMCRDIEAGIRFKPREDKSATSSLQLLST